jgi:hypothetical protein
MSRPNDIGKKLGPWLGKAQAIGEPPKSDQTMGVIARPERAAVGRDGDRLTQLNFKIPHSTKRRIKQLAVRDNITLLTMLDRMLELYEREHGKLGTR